GVRRAWRRRLRQQTLRHGLRARWPSGNGQLRAGAGLRWRSGASGRHGERRPARGSVRVPRDAGRAGATVEIGGTTMRRWPRPRRAHRHERDRRTVYRGPRVGLPAGFRPYRTVRAHRCGPAPRAPPPRTPGGCYSAGADPGSQPQGGRRSRATGRGDTAPDRFRHDGPRPPGRRRAWIRAQRDHRRSPPRVRDNAGRRGLFDPCAAEAKAQKLQRQVAPLRTALDDRFGFDAIIGRAPKFMAAIDDARKVAVTGTTVLLTGESGTGKEVLARAIHHASPRAEGPFVALNCAALPETLIESELFGHERGAFTGADKLKRGRFELAAAGTLFLDEIGELAPAAQATLLRVLQERRYERVGGTTTLEADIRLIAATNRDLERGVADARFRED